MATNTFVNIVTIKCFNGQALEAAKYVACIANAAGWYVKQARMNALQIGFMRLMVFTMFVQGFWYGHYLVAANKTAFGNVVTCFMSCLTATEAVEQILPQMLVLEKGRAAGTALLKVSGQWPPHMGAKPSLPASCHGHFILRGVSFAYPTRSENLVLKNFDAEFCAGETTFLVGQSGSGKSTIGQILIRFYDPTSGSILLDGRRLQSLDTDWLRRSVVLVEQTSTLFAGSIRDNICLGRPGQQVPAEEVKQAVQFALLEQTINDLPQGLDTIVTDKGSLFSGGQRQRIALARARLKDAPVLILDESTSALDQTARALIMTAIRHWRNGRTNIIITHDLSQIEATDHVYVLEYGNVVKQGYGGNPPTTSSSAALPPSTADQNISSRSTVDAAPAMSPTTPRFQTSSNKTAGVEARSRNRRTRMSYVPAIFAGASLADFSRVSHAPALPIRFHDPFGAKEPDTSMQARRRKSRLPPASSSTLRGQDGHIGKSRIARLSMELAQLTGIQAVEARPRSRQGQRKRPISTSMFKHASTDPPSPDVVRDLEDRSPRPVRQILRTVWPNLSQRQRCLLVLGLTATIVHAALVPVFSFVVSKLLATFFDTQNGTAKAKTYSLWIIGIASLDAVACCLMHLLLEYCGQSWVDAIRSQALRHVLDQSLEWFRRKENGAPRLTGSLDRNAEEMRNLLGRFAAFMLIAVVLMLVSIVWSLIESWRLALVGLSMGPVSLIVTRGFQTVSARMEGLCNDAMAKSTAILYETFISVKTTRALTLESVFMKQYHEAIDNAFKTGFQRAVYCGIFFGLSEALVIFTEALIFWYASVLCASNQSSVQNILTVLSLLLFGFSSVSGSVAMIPQLSISKESATQLLDLSELSALSHEHDGDLDAPGAGDVVCRDLTFAYPTKPETHIFWKFNQTFTHGTSTAIVGPSGSGKSTIASLLLRLYATPTSSALPQITVNNININRINATSLRRHIAIVPQTPVLFPGTVSENIAYGIPPHSADASLENVKAAAIAASIAPFINTLPQGYDTLLGDGGLTLSGGQAQRIAIARALVRQSRVLVLDEVTSALDTQSASLVRDTIKSLIRKGGLTVIIITHAREMMEIADKIVMLADGRVVERGRYTELLKRNGKFAVMMGGGVWKGGERADTRRRGERSRTRGSDATYERDRHRRDDTTSHLFGSVPRSGSVSRSRSRSRSRPRPIFGNVEWGPR
ncbi:MAG: hypothetical protein Q9162_001958 [Coniocarpon cinnabarinum]